MADIKIPNPLERRHLVERELPAEQALGLAEAYLAEDRASEAVAFLVKAGASERLEQLAGGAVAAGDLFLLRAIAEGRGSEPSADEWRRLAVAARELGKDAYAEAAERLASRGEG